MPSSVSASSGNGAIVIDAYMEEAAAENVSAAALIVEKHAYGGFFNEITPFA